MLKRLGLVLLFIITVIISPVEFVFYLLWWIGTGKFPQMSFAEVASKMSNA